MRQKRVLSPQMLATFLAAGMIAGMLDNLGPLQAQDPPAEPGPTPAGQVSPAANEADVEGVASLVRPSLVSISSTDRDGKKHGVGTGFVISSEGLIATNLHVIGENRKFQIEAADGRNLPITSIHATDRLYDLAIIRVELADGSLPALKLGDSETATPGVRVVAMGNPLGWKNSVVQGIVSERREIDGRSMLQLAMPIEPGNSGGPVVNTEGKVLGIVTMKSLVTLNLGFAIEVNALRRLMEQPNPVPYKSWLTIDRMPASRWTTSGGADWRQRAGRIQVSGTAEGFAGRSLCLSTSEPTTDPADESFELAVEVRMEDESGAAGLAFHSDGGNRHYGFYPSAGKIRFTAFQGPDVFSWRVLHDEPSTHYRAGQWNELKIRVEPERILCFVNGELVFETKDKTFARGSVGLAKFRDTKASFRSFTVGAKIVSSKITVEQQTKGLAKLQGIGDIRDLRQVDVSQLVEDSHITGVVIAARLAQLEVERLRLTALQDEVKLQEVVTAIKKAMASETPALLSTALLLGKADDPEVQVGAYVDYVTQLAEEIRPKMPEGKAATAAARFAVLRRVVFEELGFHGSRHEYYHPANSHMHRVIDDREGLPISLSVFYICLAKHFDLQVEGVGLPGHFVVRELHGDDVSQLIDPFEGGKLLSREAADKLVRANAGVPLTDEMLIPTDEKTILRRMASNLIGAAERRQDQASLRRYLELAVELEPESVQLRGMRALARFQAKRRQLALEDLQWFSDNKPAGIDLNRIEELRQFFLQP
jgi:serine protease Do